MCYCCNSPRTINTTKLYVPKVPCTIGTCTTLRLIKSERFLRNRNLKSKITKINIKYNNAYFFYCITVSPYHVYHHITIIHTLVTFLTTPRLMPDAFDAHALKNLTSSELLVDLQISLNYKLVPSLALFSCNQRLLTSLQSLKSIRLC